MLKYVTTFFFEITNQQHWLFIFVVLTILSALFTIVLTLIPIAYYTLAERKIMAGIQRRKGPNMVGPFGLLQPIADGFKLAIKSKIDLRFSNSYLFNVAPILILTLSLVSWFFIPLTPGLFMFHKTELSDLVLSLVQNNYINSSFNKSFFYLLQDIIKNFQPGSLKYLTVGFLFILAISSFNVYGIILAGWSSNSKYAFMGSLRSAAQMISYEVSIGLTILPVLLLTGNLLSLSDIFLKFYSTNGQRSFEFLFPCFIIFFISMLAETNRTPFDLTEAEAELVAGYNVEYSSIVFAMFFLAEYSNMLLMSVIIVILFLGSLSLAGFIFQVVNFIIIFVVVRAALPRYKYNELMDLGWKVFLPITLSFLVFVSSIVLLFKAQISNI